MTRGYYTDFCRLRVFGNWVLRKIFGALEGGIDRALAKTVYCGALLFLHVKWQYKRQSNETQFSKQHTTLLHVSIRKESSSGNLYKRN